MNQLSDRLNSLSPSATLAMSQKSSEYNEPTFRSFEQPVAIGYIGYVAKEQRIKSSRY